MMGLPETTGTLLKIKKGRVVDDRRIDLSEVYNMGKIELEKQCIYLMRKRVALEDSINELERKNKGLFNAVKNRDRDIERLAKELEDQKALMNQQLERLNKETNAQLSELVAENVRLTNENTELKRTVNRG